ncbi:Factor arrest protein [Taphrina deformans PYCC 5710]|uniref:Factor arrest protein n=1 Tax=Taphrina deformans (strain PYCC 5710 / ATCC 11124 / CBS 356.35 / IMI 108563 / JCM 9778 / NBRC 8474) TaxID=1097556 RepID=R4X7M8_TAPDE|nr:Factor arrest protein [Taphrina deformans PYCC 5710]|eukprot:CCG81436.1 Factor arrest protein [Taphrina deformans PYCC 5710]
MSAMPKLLIFHDRKVLIKEGDVIPVGRASVKNKISSQPDNLIFDNPVLSREHAIVYMDNGHVYVKDERSTHGSIYYSPDGTRHQLSAHVPQLLGDKGKLNLGADVLRGSDVYKKVSGTIGLFDSPATPPTKTSIDLFPVVTRDVTSVDIDEDDTRSEMTCESHDRKSDVPLFVPAHNSNVTLGDVASKSFVRFDDDSKTEVKNVLVDDLFSRIVQTETDADFELEVVRAKERSLAAKRKEILGIMVARRLSKAKAEAEQKEKLAEVMALSPQPNFAHLTSDTHPCERTEGLTALLNNDQEVERSSFEEQAVDTHISDGIPLVRNQPTEHLMVDLETGGTSSHMRITDDWAWLGHSVSRGHPDRDLRAIWEGSSSSASEAPSEYDTRALAKEAGEEIYYPGALESLNAAVERPYSPGDYDDDYPRPEDFSSSHDLIAAGDTPSRLTIRNHEVEWQKWDEFTDESDHESEADPGRSVSGQMTGQGSVGPAGADQSSAMIDVLSEYEPHNEHFVPDTLQNSSEKFQVQEVDTGGTRSDGVQQLTRPTSVIANDYRQCLKRSAPDAQPDDNVSVTKRVKAELPTISWSASLKRTALGMLLGAGLTFGSLAALGASG